MNIGKKVFVVFCVACLSGNLSAATITVTTTADSGAGSFREAAAAISAGDTIEFDITTGPFEIDIASTQTIPVNCTIDGTNGGSGITFTTSNASVMELGADVECTIIGTSGTLSVDVVVEQAGGASGFIKEGVLIFSLSALNTNEKAMELDVGQVTVANDAALGSGSPVEMNSGTILSVASGINAANSIDIVSSGNGIFHVAAGTGTLLGEISGSGSFLTKTGDGTLALAGTSTYDGGTTVSQGTLALIGNGSLSNAGSVSVNGAAIFDISGMIPVSTEIGSFSSEVGTELKLGNKLLYIVQQAADDSEIAGLISGGVGALQIAIPDGGSITFSHANTFAGGTILENGHVILANNTGLGTGDILMLFGDNKLSFDENIEVSNDIIITSGTSFSAVLDVPVGIATLSGEIQGPSTVPTLKTGAGSLVLSGESAYSDELYVNEGTCVFNGVFPGTITVASGASVKGIGSIGPLTIENGGTLAPGNSIGTITVESLSLETGSITEIEFDATTTSLIDVTGAADVGGTLNLIQKEAVYLGEGSYEIITASSVTSEFDNITGGLANFNFSLGYTENSVILFYDVNPSSTVSTAGLNGNILKFTNYLNASAPHSDEYLILTELSGKNLYDAINSISPARNAFGPYVTQQTVFSFSNLVNNYLDCKRFFKSHKISKEAAKVFLPFELDLEEAFARISADEAFMKSLQKNYNLWVSGFVDIARQVAVDQNTSFEFTSEGIFLGFDNEWCEDGSAGCVLAAAFSQVTDGDAMGSSDIVYGATSVYSDYYWKEFYLRGAVWGVFHQISNRRNITYPDVEAKANAEINGGQFDPHLELGWIKTYTTFKMQPYAALDCVLNWEGSYTETGAGNLNMHAKFQTNALFQTVLGMRFYQSIEKPYSRIGLKEGLSYINRTPLAAGAVTTSIFGSSDFVTLKSFTGSQELVAFEANFFAEMGRKRDVIISFGYQGQFGAEYISNELMFTFSKNY